MHFRYGDPVRITTEALEPGDTEETGHVIQVFDDEGWVIVAFPDSPLPIIFENPGELELDYGGN